MVHYETRGSWATSLTWENNSNHNVDYEKIKPIIYFMRIEWFLFWKKTRIPFIQLKDNLCQISLKLAQQFWKRRFLNSSMYFHYFVIISPWKKVGPFIWTNLNPHYPRRHSAKFDWNSSSCSGEEDFIISSVYFRYFLIISPWKEVWTIYLNTRKLESPSSKDALC